MDTPFSFSGSGIVSHFLTFSPCLIALIYLFSAVGKRKSVGGTNQSNNEVVDKSSCCASCGKAAVDDIELKECDGCDLVRYCSDECQQNHQSEHEESCKKRATELRDEQLFKQPEGTHMGDCPICMVPLGFDSRKFMMYACCSKVICKDCASANTIRELEQSLLHSCPFCRKPVPKTEEECHRRRMKRIEANNPVAMCQEGSVQYEQGNYTCAFEYLAKAAELGNADAHCKLAGMYDLGKGVEKDEGKYTRHLEEAAIGGHSHARVLLGIYEYSNNNLDRAVKHWMIAATQGDDDSIKALMIAFRDGYVEKEVLAAALRAHHAAVDATKSPHRKEAEEVEITILVNGKEV